MGAGPKPSPILMSDHRLAGGGLGKGMGMPDPICPPPRSKWAGPRNNPGPDRATEEDPVRSSAPAVRVAGEGTVES